MARRVSDRTSSFNKARAALVAATLFLVTLSVIPALATHSGTSSIQQQWELLSGEEAGVTTTKTVSIHRGSIGGTSLVPVPSISFDAVGRVQGATGNGKWTIELRSFSGVLGSVEFDAADTDFTFSTPVSPVTWSPAVASALESLRLVPSAGIGSTAGTLHLKKAEPANDSETHPVMSLVSSFG